MSWSLSRLQCYEKCAAQYKFRYVELLPVGLPGPAAARGTLAHAAMENYIKGELKQLPDEISFYQQFLDNIIAHSDCELVPELKLAVDKEWKPADFDGDYWWRGVLDLFLKHPQIVIVYDWKTGKVYDDHQDQREIYSLGIFSHHDVDEVRAVHVYLDHKLNRETIYHRNMVPELREKWTGRVEKMLNDTDLIPSPGFYCRYCNFSRAKGGPCRF